MSAKDSENSEMFTAEYIRDEAMMLVRECAAPAEGLSVKAQKRRAAQRLKWTFNRTEDIWYGEAKIKPEELLTLQWQANKARERAEQRMGLIDEIRQKVERSFPRRDVRGNGPLVDMAGARGREDS